MHEDTKKIVGALVLIIIATGVIVLWPSEGLKLEVSKDKTTFYVYDESWDVAGVERVAVFQGNKKLKPINTNIESIVNEEKQTITIKRTSNYAEGPNIINTYFFEGNNTDKENFPVYHEINVKQGNGFIIEYELRNIEYEGRTFKDPQSPLYFGKSMKLEMDKQMYWSTIYMSGIYKARYRPSSSEEVYNIRLFESPPEILGGITERFEKQNELRLWVVLRDPVEVGMTKELVAEQFKKQGIIIPEVFDYSNAFSIIADKKTFNEIKKYAVVKRIYYDEEIKVFLDGSPKSIDVINATEVWNQQVNSENVTGEGIVVCVIDSGIDYTHPDLGNCTNTTFLAGTCEKVIGGYDRINTDNDPVDDYSHGSHVAGIIGADGVITGVAPSVRFVAYKALDHEGTGYMSYFADGINWCIANKDTFNISVITISAGGTSRYETNSACDSAWADIADAIENATIHNNIIFTSATGNDGWTTGIASPSCHTHAISVMATNRTDGLYSSNNRGSNFEKLLLAPGMSINSTILSSSYGVKTGTSMAAPHVAGIAALFKQIKPALNYTDFFLALNESGEVIYDSGINESITRVDAYEASLTEYLETESNITVKYYTYEDYLDSESFETNWGIWRNASYNDFNLTISTTTPASIGAKDGEYVVFQPDNLQYLNGSIEIESLNWSNLKNAKISFWYSRFKSPYPNIYLEENTSGSWVEIWSATGSVSPYVTDWRFIENDISNLSGTGSLRIRFMAPNNGVGDVGAVDLINLSYDEVTGTHSGNVDVEIGTELLIEATDEEGGSICISSDNPVAPSSCGTSSTTVTFDVLSGYKEFNDGTEDKNYTFSSAPNQEVSNSLNKLLNDSEVLNFNFDVEGYNSSSEYPKNLIFNFNEENKTIFGELIGDEIVTKEFSDETEYQTLVYTEGGVKTTNLLLSKSQEVFSAYLNLTGIQTLYFEQEQTTISDSTGNRYLIYSPVCAYKSGHDYIYCFGGSCIGSDLCGGQYNTTVRIALGGGSGSATARTDVPYKAGVGACAVSDGTYYYVLGGYDETTFYDDLVRYDGSGVGGPGAANTFTAMADMPVPKAYHQCAYHEETDSIFVMGGYTTGTTVNSAIYRYNITANTWSSALTAPPFGMEQGWAQQYEEDTIAFIGGTRAGATSGGRFYIYNVTNDSWVTGATIAGNPYGNRGVIIDGEIYTYGGIYSSSLDEIAFKYVDSGTASWVRTSNNLSNDFYQGSCVVVDSYAVCVDSGGVGYSDIYREIYHYPKDVNIQIGDTLGIAYEGSGSLNNTGLEMTNNLSEKINDELESCNENSENICNITIYVGNQGAGNINLSGLEIKAEANNISFTPNNYTCDSTTCDTNLTIYSDKNGSVEVSNVNLTFKGTSSMTWSFNTTNETTTKIWDLYHSKINKDLSYDWTDTVFFLPRSYNQAYVDAYGQTQNTPVYNITGEAQSKGFNLSLSVSETLSCLTWYFNTNNNSTNSTEFFINKTFVKEMTKNENINLWLWASLTNCNASVNRYLRPELRIDTCCESCIGCE